MSFSHQGKEGDEYFSKKQLKRKALFMNKNEIDGLLKKVNKKIKMNNRFNMRFKGVNFKDEITSKYLKGLQSTERYLKNLMTKKDEAEKKR